MDDQSKDSRSLVGIDDGSQIIGNRDEIGTEKTSEINSTADNTGNDTSGSTASGSTSSGDVSENTGQIGDTSEVSESSSSSTYEGVSSEDFTTFADVVTVRLDGLMASTLVMLFALFVCVGILAVNEIVTSMRG